MKKQSFLVGSAILMASAAAVKIMGAVFKIPLANMLGGTGMGYFSCAYGVFMPVYAVSVTGLPTAVAAVTAENRALGRFGNILNIRKTALSIFGLFGLAASLLLMLLAVPICRFSGTEYVLPSVLMIAPTILTGCLTAVYRGLWEGMRNMYPTAISQVIEASVKLLWGLSFCGLTLTLARRDPVLYAKIFAFMGDDPLSEQAVLSAASAAAVSGITVSGIFSALYLAIKDGKFRRELWLENPENTDNKVMGQLLSVAIPVAVGSLITNLTSIADLSTITAIIGKTAAENLDYFSSMCGGLDDPEGIANFIFGSFTGLAVTVFNLVPSFTNMFGKGMIPAMSEAWAAGDREKIRRSVCDGITACAAVAFPCGLGITALAEPVLFTLFASRPNEAAISVVPLKILGIGVVFLSLTAPIFAMLQAAGRADIPVKLMAVGAAVKLLLNLLLVPIPTVNVSGAAMATTVCYGLLSAVSVTVLCRHTKTGIREALSPLFGICFSGILCALGAGFVSDMLAGSVSRVVNLEISVIFGGLIYIISIFLQPKLLKRMLKMLKS